MQNDIKTKSTDFLPGKPSIDSVAKSPASQPNIDTNLKPVTAPSSAHVIDLKKASVSPVDSPLLNNQSANQEIEEPTSITPEFDGIQKDAKPKSDISAKPMSDEANPTVAKDDVTPTDQSSQEHKDINSLNLTEPTTHQDSTESVDKPKKSSKLKWLLFAILFIIVGAAVAVGVIYALNTLAI